MNINDNTLIKQSSQCCYQIIEGKAVVVYPQSRQIHWLNEVATDIWQFISKAKTPKEIAEHICSIYDVDKQTAKRDVVEFLKEASKLKIVEIKNPDVRR